MGAGLDDRPAGRWIATATIGFDGRGKRITRKASGTTKTAAKAKLREILRERENGTPVTTGKYTVGDAVHDWLAYGLTGRSPATMSNYATIAEKHIDGQLGARKLRDLTADDVDRWLRTEARSVSTRTLRLMHSLLNRSVRHAMARDKVMRNVVELCSVPTGRAGRRSKSLTFTRPRSCSGRPRPARCVPTSSCRC
ncbi:hypothetical protein [Pseudonocardia sp. C8]|uniref:hypothetical protein n=1 Tax=Pseudonocardia sp. C8 TaxID=2762759 RepID=UPI001C92EB07|nr:hypothetical protein [Pseudonocardia sp. C8]